MIIHKLIAHHLKNKDDPAFYVLQAQDSVKWLELNGIVIKKDMSVLDMGCGHGIFGAEYLKRGCKVTFSDETNALHPSLADLPYVKFNLDKDDYLSLGQYDLVLCSNVFEHLANPDRFISQIDKLLKPGGMLYLTWTNWLSPWGGHEFSPFQYLGSKRGHLIYDRLLKKQRIHTPYENLFPTYIGKTVHKINSQQNLRVLKVVPRYYPEFSFLMHIPVLREFLAWNCAILAEKRAI
jgi:SAM-dependent methyltransferase